ncbi:threonylcarbamoyl-AMP synthase [Candidatus Gottesmanbacteria bacterium]|nr:threonylcarbamoyl-AMP synthase [Candidatus Gottesmanbacteria bacterium]
MVGKDRVIQGAIDALISGGIVIYPTDTAFGIGCRMDDQKAVDRLFAIRRRPLTQATPVLVSSESMALAYYLDTPEIVRHLMKTYWPGALTIIARCKKDFVYSPIRGGGETIGLRMPNHETTLALIRGVGVPILGPSANFHGHPTPYRFEDLDPQLVKLVDFVVPGVCSIGEASTVVDCSVRLYRIVRQGSVVLRDISIVIDSSGSEAIRVALETRGGQCHELKKPVSHTKAQGVLPMIEELLMKHEFTLDDVAAIQVNTGPGSYTGLRVGIAIANMLGELLGVSVNGLPVGQSVTPVYEGDRW